MNETDDIRARRDAILAGTQADWDEGKVFEATGVTPEARAELARGRCAEHGGRDLVACDHYGTGA